MMFKNTSKIKLERDSSFAEKRVMYLGVVCSHATVIHLRYDLEGYHPLAIRLSINKKKIQMKDVFDRFPFSKLSEDEKQAEWDLIKKAKKEIGSWDFLKKNASNVSIDAFETPQRKFRRLNVPSNFILGILRVQEDGDQGKTRREPGDQPSSDGVQR